MSSAQSELAGRHLEGTALSRGTILECIGRTPLFDLRRLSSAAGLPTGSRLLAKGEFLNPGGSGKDRLATALIAEAEQRGLAPGGTIVEATSGNTGISLAMAASVRGYRLQVVVSTKVSHEKLRILRSLGARVHVTPNVGHGDPGHYTHVAQMLAEKIPGAIYLDQFHSEASIRVHESATGPELLDQALSLAGRLDAFVCGVGTGGTLVGVARYLQRASPQTRVVLADPEGSVLAGGDGFRPYLVEGIGDDSSPPLFDPACTQGAVTVSDEESFRHALLAGRLEGLFVGGSSGCHLAASIRVARGLPAGSVVATVLPDTGRNYLSKFLDPAWCSAHGFPRLHDEEVP